MVNWLKHKHRVPKTTGRYHSTHNDGTRRRRRTKVSDKMKQVIQASQPKVVLVVGPTGKRRFVRG